MLPNRVRTHILSMRLFHLGALLLVLPLPASNSQPYE